MHLMASSPLLSLIASIRRFGRATFVFRIHRGMGPKIPTQPRCRRLLRR